MQATDLGPFDVVRVRVDFPAEGVRRGDEGTIVDRSVRGAFIIEFVDDDGRMTALVFADPKDVELVARYPTVEPAVIAESP